MKPLLHQRKAGRRTTDTVRTGGSQWLFAAIPVVGLIVGVLHFSEVERFAEMLRRARPLWLIAAILLQAGTYVAVALGWETVLRRAGSPRPISRLLLVALAKLFADQAIPGAGIAGHLVLVERLSQLGVERGTAVATLLVALVGYYAGYALLALAMLFVLWLHGQATPLLAGLVTSFLLVALAIPSLALWLRARGSAPLPGWIARVSIVRRLVSTVKEAPRSLVTDRALIAQVGGYSALVFLLDAATLAICLCAVGGPFRPATAFIALICASIVTTLGPIPLGLGTFEATSIAMLVMLGTPLEAAVTATLLLRGMTLWLPLLPSMVMMQHAGRAAR